MSTEKLLIIIVLLSATSLAMADVYRWVDENGYIHYGDKPPRSEQAGDLRQVEIDAGNESLPQTETASGIKLDRGRKTITLPDGSKYPMPRTEEEAKKLREILMRNRRAYDLPNQEVGANTGQYASLGQSSFGHKPEPHQFTDMNGALKKRVGEEGFGHIKRPVTAAGVFPECDPTRLLVGTERSSLCDLWDEHLTYLEGRLREECVSAGERVYKTVTNVDGIVLLDPTTDPENTEILPRSNVLHEHPSRSANEYMYPSLARLYRMIEYYDSRKKSYVTQKLAGVRDKHHLDTTVSESSEPQSRFEVSYKYLTTKDDHDQGLFGDITWIKDRKTGELLAERKIYYFMLGDHVRMSDGTSIRMPGKHINYGQSKFRFFYPCEDYVPRVTRKEKHHPRGEYEFVSRVLIPTPFTKSENILLYDLSVGSGVIRHTCVLAQTFGPGITPSNLVVKRLGMDLTITYQGGNDSLICENYFRSLTATELLFTDGQYWDEKQILEHGGLEWPRYQ